MSLNRIYNNIPNSFCMDHSICRYSVRNNRFHAVAIDGYLPLGDSFTREMCQCLNQLSVLE